MYYFLHSQANGPFSIGATSGAIHLAGALSHNTNPTYTITIRARVSGNRVQAGIKKVYFIDKYMSFDIAELT